MCGNESDRTTKTSHLSNSLGVSPKTLQRGGLIDTHTYTQERNKWCVGTGIDPGPLAVRLDCPIYASLQLPCFTSSLLLSHVFEVFVSDNIHTCISEKD
jgi:hypothetical protein